LKRDTATVGTMDPYVRVLCGKNHSKKSKVCKDGGIKPNFHGENLDFEIKPQDAEILEINLYDDGGMFKSEDTLVGSGKYNLQELFAKKGMKHSDGVDIYHDGKNVGNIDCLITFIEDPNAPKP